MNVVYDVSALGVNPSHIQTRTGIFRVVYSVARGLKNSNDCDLIFCANESFKQLELALRYLSDDQHLSDVPFALPSGRAFRAAALNLNGHIARINGSPRVSFISKVLRRLSLHSLNFLEINSRRFDPRRLPQEGIFHSPFFALPDRSEMPMKLKRFLTVYDLIPILHPEFFNSDKNHFLHNILKSIGNDDRVFSISEATRDDLCDYLSIAPDRIAITHLAAAPELFYPCYDTEALRCTRKKYGIPDSPYILSLNTLEPRKNVAHTIRSFARLLLQQKIQNLYLILVGTEGWDYSKVFEAITECGWARDRIILTGYVDDEDLAALYSGALAFVYMSFYEGFGLPPLEAMQCGVPVITSNTSSLPEVVGDAGILLDPTDMDGLGGSLLALYESQSLRDAMSLKSINRAKRFSWQKCAQETISAYKAALTN